LAQGSRLKAEGSRQKGDPQIDPQIKTIVKPKNKYNPQISQIYAD
jgi:hypothetical protein